MSDSKENPCPDCGEMVRINSLRCWNCGAFMNREVEEKYLEMQAKPQETIYSSLPAEEVSSLPESAEASTPESEDDFELSMPVTPPVVGETSTEAASNSLPVDLNALADTKKTENPLASSTPKKESDDLFDIAMQDEKELQKQRRKRAQRGGLVTPGGGLIIFCPYGCRVVVKESHRGMQGKCPECKAPFIVPVNPPDFSKKKEKGSPSGESAESPAATGSEWMLDLHLHVVNPEKLKLKADSLLKDFALADVGIVGDELVLTIFNKKERSLLGKNGDPRELLKEQLAAGKKVSELEVSEKYSFGKADISDLKVVQPTASRTDSIFHGIDVFGEGRIALQLPAVEGKPEILYVSLGLTQFWELRKGLEEKLGLLGLGESSGIPPEHVYSTYRCHFTEMPVKALENIKFYKADDSVELETVGYQCGKCQIVVSEQGREKEKLGGKSPKGIAKAKCPKCSNKMGENLLQNIKTLEDPATTS